MSLVQVIAISVFIGLFMLWVILPTFLANQHDEENEVMFNNLRKKTGIEKDE